ncbi:hypothetical protein FC83_GL000944 [Agrilactobacillus composti DSM 18527 = JCM 14202]|uniref:Uncharacterized protein n=1 Tax=Agrilactobacillus composti DSM 18527 = JCM 14202 TaxID=1423734 RepID=X0PT54_9LACO|nr:hypothetical protein [Agrilactobacillus composti]KRM35639.1 hypothetical protein FC83_GL000944 [Agrilactobacillus composti DSM 18527 = JCM 14202]GAF41157.1 hypothetical protein JCM14202_3084 [Agrilactobacillus composti DSM 18527 = JCM 14202]
MYIFLVLLVISVIIFLLWLNAKREGKSTIISNKYAYISLGVAIISLGGWVGLSTTPTNNNASSDTSVSSKNEETPSSSSNSVGKNATDSKSNKDSSSEEPNDNHIIDTLTDEQRSTYNSNMSNSLEEDKNFANQGKEEFNWSLYTDKIIADRNTGLVAYVNEAFINLGNSDKKIVANYIQTFAKGELALMDISVPGTDFIYLNIHYGNDRIGHSKAFAMNEFKWK